jgi:chromate transporter
MGLGIIPTTAKCAGTVPMTTSDDHTAHPYLAPLAWVFARYANFTLGGGSATTAVLHHELVGKRRWITEDRFILCFALGRLTPGTNLLAFCTGVGCLLRGMAGAVVALMAASFPCASMVIVLTALFSEWQQNRFAQSAIHGAIAAAVAITVKTVWTISKRFQGNGKGPVPGRPWISSMLDRC